jgi:hypothetical protein
MLAFAAERTVENLVAVAGTALPVFAHALPILPLNGPSKLRITQAAEPAEPVRKAVLAMD